MRTRGPAPRLPFEAGLCARCVHMDLVASTRSVFVRCGLAASDSVFPKYPALPVVECSGFRERARSAAGGGEG